MSISREARGFLEVAAIIRNEQFFHRFHLLPSAEREPKEARGTETQGCQHNIDMESYVKRLSLRVR